MSDTSSSDQKPRSPPSHPGLGRSVSSSAVIGLDLALMPPSDHRVESNPGMFNSRLVAEKVTFCYSLLGKFAKAHSSELCGGRGDMPFTGSHKRPKGVQQCAVWRRR
jgi:hypothetical protein